MLLSSYKTLTCTAIGGNKHTSISKKYEVRTSLYGLNKANQYLTSEVLMDDNCNGGKDDYSDILESYIIIHAQVRYYSAL